jgi:hypothetical protein
MAQRRIGRRTLMIGGLLAVAAASIAAVRLAGDRPDRRLVAIGEEAPSNVETDGRGPGSSLPAPAEVPDNAKKAPQPKAPEPEASGGTGGTGATSPPPPGGFPNPASTGVPAGWVPRQTVSSDITVRTPGTVIEDVRLTNGASISVYADNVTIRRVEMQGGTITNQFGDAPAGCGHNMLVEDVSFEQASGSFVPSDFPVIGEGSYTARRIEVDGRGEGPRLSDCGPVTLEDSFLRIHGADEGTAACDQVHSDGVQAVAGVGGTARNNTIIFQTSCGTSPWFVVNPAVNTGNYIIDRLLVSGGGYSFRQEVSASVTGLNIVDGAWVYGPLDEMDCSRITRWDAKLVNIDANYQVTRVVRDQPCGNG